MKIDLVTKEDLEQFKTELFAEMKKILSNESSTTDKSWLRSVEVRKLLKISPGTLQTLRVNGTLPFSRVGSIHYYKRSDIEKILGGKK